MGNTLKWTNMHFEGYDNWKAEGSSYSIPYKFIKSSDGVGHSNESRRVDQDIAYNRPEKFDFIFQA